jgi:pantetheine-phosphate adenylyltransferase
MPSAIYAGSFDPPTNGHVDILKQAVTLFGVEGVSIWIATNPMKKYMFTAEEREHIWKHTLGRLGWAGLVRAEALPWNRFTAEYAERARYTHLIRGLRGVSDLEEEIIIHDINKRIAPAIQTVYFMTTPELRAVSSSIVKGLVGHQGWTEVVEELVPTASMRALLQIQSGNW